jgi:hypothetical protein
LLRNVNDKTLSPLLKTFIESPQTQWSKS